MSNGFNISIGSDERDFLRGVKNSEEATQGLSDALAKVDTAGDKAGQQLEQSMRASQKATQAATNAIKDGENALRQSATVSRQANQEGLEDLELTTRERTRIVREGVNTAGETAKQAALQGLQSIDGSVEGSLNAVQNVVAGVFGTLGPEGLAVGAAVSAAVGLIAGAFQQASESEKDFEADVSSLTTTLIAAKDGKASIDDITKSLAGLAEETDPAKVSLKELFDTAKTAGTSATDLAKAYAGDTDKLKELDAQQKKNLATDQKAVQQSEIGTQGRNRETASLKAKTDAEQKEVDLLDSTIKKQDAASASAAQYSKVQKSLGDSTTDLIAKQAAAAAQATSDFSDVADQLEAKQEQANAVAQQQSEKTKQTVVANNEFTAQSFIDAQNQELATLQDEKANEITIYEKFGQTVGQSLIDGLKGKTDKADILAGLAQSTPDQVAKITANSKAVGKLAGESAAKEAQTQVSANQMVGRYVVKADTSDIAPAVKKATSGTVFQKVVVDVYTRDGKKIS